MAQPNILLTPPLGSCPTQPLAQFLLAWEHVKADHDHPLSLRATFDEIVKATQIPLSAVVAALIYADGKGSARVDQHNSRVDVELPRSIRTGRASMF